MATQARKKFELDHSILVTLSEDPNNQEALMELIRSVKLKRAFEKHNEPKEAYDDWYGFETK